MIKERSVWYTIELTVILLIHLFNFTRKMIGPEDIDKITLIVKNNCYVILVMAVLLAIIGTSVYFLWRQTDLRDQLRVYETIMFKIARIAGGSGEAFDNNEVNAKYLKELEFFKKLNSLEQKEYLDMSRQEKLNKYGAYLS